MKESDIFEDIMEWGMDQGHITYGEIHSAFPPEYSNNENLEPFITLLQDMGVKIADEQGGDDEKEQREENDGPERSDNLVQNYLHSMGDIKILTRDEAAELAKRMETGNKIIEDVVSGLPFYHKVKKSNADNHRHNIEAENLGEDLSKALEIVDELAVACDSKEIRSKAGITVEEFRIRYDSISRARMFVSDAKDELITRNLRLVITVAKRYIGRGLPLIDLIQEGNIGLMKAVDRFDYRRGFKFSTYAIWWIKQAIIRAIMDQTRTVRIPVHVVEMYNRINGAVKELIHSTGREPSTEQISLKIGVPERKVLEVYSAIQDSISIHSPAGDNKYSLEDSISDKKASSPYLDAERNKATEHIVKILHTLTPKEEIVIKMRFGIGCERDYTLEEVGRHLSITRERVRQVEEKAMKKLKHPRKLRRLRELMTD
ncbi:MAG TPA: sigma-70 family RNA polymerase sigma factor [Thermodesulfovibrionales bacterium]|nr:sigma-70 family RNA polymerase sigma factor [Thermodesulfovibrionales bacterium]